MAFEAKYEGICDVCGEKIKPGEQVQNATEAQRAAFPYEHVKCPDLDPNEGKVCGKCFLVHAGECNW